MTKTRKILEPQYVAKFKCIGPACEDNCCIGWRVDIDKNTYQKYRNCSDKQLKQQMDEKVTRNRTNASPANYAKIVLNPDGVCPFIDKDKLCAIQRNLGEPYLSVTCTTYPRFTNTVNGNLERSLTMSCPEAARQALLNTNLMEFDIIEEDIAVRCNVGTVLDTSEMKMSQRPLKYFWDLRIFIISLLQNRTYQLWQRLVILGLFCNRLTQIVSDRGVQEIPQLIETYRNNIEQGVYRDDFDSIPNQIIIQMELMKELADERFFNGINNQRFLQCYTEFLNGIQYSEGTAKEEIGGRYAEAHDAYYQRFMQEHEYILENYLVNFVFKNLFPINGEKHIFDNYVRLIAQYAMIKMLLIGMAGFHKENFGTEQVIRLIQSFAKVIEHNNGYVKQAFNLLKDNNMNTLAYMAILIKN